MISNLSHLAMQGLSWIVKSCYYGYSWFALVSVKVKPRDKRLKTDCWFSSFQFILALIMKMLDTEKQTLFG